MAQGSFALSPTEQTEQCPDCRATLPKLDYEGHPHPYIGASPGCWTLFSNLANAGSPPIASGPLNGLLVDAYAAQHYGVPSPQAIQSVAVHLLVLYGVLEGKVPAKSAQWVRQRSVRPLPTPKHDRFHWLTPPDFTDCLKIIDIVRAPTPEARTMKVGQYVAQVWAIWRKNHGKTVEIWYAEYIEKEI